MDKKVTSIEALYLAKEQQRTLLKAIEELVVEKIFTDENKRVEDLVLLKYFQEAIQSIAKYKFLSQKQVQIFFENVSVILDREQDELEKMLDIGVYTCMVYASLGKILNYELKNILPIMLAFIETDVSVSAFSKYLNVFLSDDILNTIEEECDNEFLSSSLVELIQNNSIFGQDATIAIPILNKQLQDYLEKYSKKRKVDWSKGWFTEEISYQKIYQKVWEQMNYFNEYTASPIYNEEQFRKLAQLKKFIYLNEEEQALFLKTVQVMDEKISSALDKIDRIFMLIDSFSLNIKENCVITVDFKNKRK